MPDGNKDAKTQAAQQEGDAGYGNSRVITADEYFKRVRNSYVRGCKWSAEAKACETKKN